MAKRGERRPWRMVAQWPGGTPWVATFTTRERAEDAAARQRAIVGAQSGEANCVVRVEHCAELDGLVATETISTIRIRCDAPAPLALNGAAYAGCALDAGHDGDHEITVRWSR